MDYDNLVKQRRRNWDPLKPDEVRRREKEEERNRVQEEREKAGKGFRQDRIDKRKAEDAEREVVEYRRMVRQVGVLVAVFFGVILVSVAVIEIWKYQERAAWLAKIETTNRAIAAGERINDLTDPIGAMATWRSAWDAKDMDRLVRLYSPRMIEKQSSARDVQRIIDEHRRQLGRGAMDQQRDIALLFFEPEIVHVPSQPWSNGELALFRTDHVTFINEDGPGRRYVAAFSWNGNLKRWEFADSREELFFSVRWRNESQIPVTRGGPRAQRFDGDGNRVN